MRPAQVAECPQEFTELPQWVAWDETLPEQPTKRDRVLDLAMDIEELFPLICGRQAPVSWIRAPVGM